MLLHRLQIKRRCCLTREDWHEGSEPAGFEPGTSIVAYGIGTPDSCEPGEIPIALWPAESSRARNRQASASSTFGSWPSTAIRPNRMGRCVCGACEERRSPGVLHLELHRDGVVGRRRSYRPKNSLAAGLIISGFHIGSKVSWAFTVSTPSIERVSVSTCS